MLSLSKKTDYALLALSYLTEIGPSRAANTREIAEKYDIPVELLAKVLQRLAKQELIVSTAGPTGGYRLAKRPEAISVATVIRVIDGTPAIAQCFRADGHGCEQLDKCTIRSPLERINARIHQMLDLISLADIARDDQGASGAAFKSRREQLPALPVR
ncbi:MAG TPA: Rrf2 family transcriptional regulator [Chthonomonadaceae bacterium]|nr:Rrf2 family transcriptional regulator [Chthonomonadaceae bacterium]